MAKREEEEAGSYAQVPIEVVAGYPHALRALSFPDDARQILLVSQYREALVQVTEGGGSLLELHRRLGQLPSSTEWTLIGYEQIASTRLWAGEMLRRLEQNDPLAQVLEVNEDILGAYIYRPESDDELKPNGARIELYWCVIGLVSNWLGCEVEDLSVVVLAHELAHAYTQLGADIEGRRWPSSEFRKAETSLKEGLAQFYTLRALRRLQDRYPHGPGVFAKLSIKQPDAYRVHEAWSELSAEAVRQAMIEVRRHREGKLNEFQTRLDRAGEVLRPIPGRPH